MQNDGECCSLRHRKPREHSNRTPTFARRHPHHVQSGRGGCAFPFRDQLARPPYGHLPGGCVRRAVVATPKNPKNAVDTHSRRLKITVNESDAKAILPERRSVKKAISYQFSLIGKKCAKYASMNSLQNQFSRRNRGSRVSCQSLIALLVTGILTASLASCKKEQQEAATANLNNAAQRGPDISSVATPDRAALAVEFQSNPRARELFASVYSASGTITKSIHTEFWSLAPKGLIPFLQVHSNALRDSFLLQIDYNFEVYRSMAASLSSHQKSYTANYSLCKARLEDMRGIASKHETAAGRFAVNQLDENVRQGEAMIEAAATGTPYRLSSGQEITYTSEFVTATLAVMQSSNDRILRLLNPNWE